jgi:hypothetical protein
MKTERKAIFCRNLQAFLKQANLDKNTLAARMNLDRDGRKWLGRLLCDGLDRSNSKSEQKLQQLCDCLGLKSTKQLWDTSLSLKASDDFHIRAVKKILKEGGSPARDLLASIEWIADRAEQAENHLAARQVQMSADQKHKALDRLYEHLRDSPHESLADPEQSVGLEVGEDEWPYDAAQFIERFQKFDQQTWDKFKSEFRRISEEHGSRGSLHDVVERYIESYGPDGFYRCLVNGDYLED